MESKTTSLVVTCLMVFVFSLDVGVHAAGLSVEDIYDSIRYSGPQYDWEEIVVTFANEGMTLVCSLTIPETRRRTPIVITLNDFAGARDEDTIPGTDEGILERAARILAEQGFASLRIDFRGSGDSDGSYEMTTFSGQISDVLAAIDFVRSALKHEVNSNSVGILGFGQGGLIGSIAASDDRGVDSVVLWSAPAHPPHDYEGFLTKQGVRAGLALPDGGVITLPVMVDGQYLFDIALGKEFFVDLFRVSPLAESRDSRKPLMYISGRSDAIVWPQPGIGETFMKYHEGPERLVVLDADHAFDFWDGPEPARLDDAIYWSTAWFIETLD